MVKHLGNIIFISLCIIFGGRGALAAKPKLLTATVGHVGQQIVTSRGVQINYLLEKALYGKDRRPGLKLPPLKWGSKNFVQEVNRVLLEWAVHLEAKTFASNYVTSLEVDRAERLAKGLLNGHPQWKKMGITRKELRLMLERKIRAKRFLKFKVRSSVVPITDGEALDYFEKNRTKFGHLPFEKLKDNVKSFLSRQQVEHRLKDWFEVLQAKHKVRNLLVGL